ncbi:MAG: PaaI family thioesterase [Thermoprotei archaeon]
MDYKEIMEVINKSPFVSYVGLRVEEISDKESIVSLVVDSRHKQRLGMVHGGIIATMVDVAMGSLVIAITGKASVSVEINVNYLSPASDGVIKAIAHLNRLGRKIHYAESRVIDDKGNLIATATGIYYSLDND